MKLKNPIMEIRKAKTPPCTQCVHSRFKAFNSVTILCNSAAYLDHVERTCCERLQGFPDDWTKIPYRGKPAEECPDGPRYKAIGNSMAVPVMRWIGERIAMAEAGEIA